jgi:acyl transferase domain-containing protein
MRPIAVDFGNFLQGSAFAVPRIPVIANVNGLPYHPGEVARCLTEQLSHPVRWLDGMNFLLQHGVTDFIELGPGDVLTKLVRSIKAQFRPVALDLQQPARDPQRSVTDWNRFYPIGTAVTVKGYDQPLVTRTPACILFGHRAAVYMQGYNGYFALDEVAPLTHATT